MSAEEYEIFVVDDDASMRQAIERLLVAAGLRYCSYESAEELLSSGKCGSARVLILDIQLPGMSGLELFQHLKTTGSAPPTIIITAQDRPNTREQVLGSGAFAYFTKPFAGSELIQAIRNQLSAA